MNAYRSLVALTSDKDLAVPPGDPPGSTGARAIALSSSSNGGAAAAQTRWELYRLLADPVRPRLLALVSLEELGVSELAELLREGQPKISRHAAALRDAGLLAARRQGTWTLLRLAPGAEDDAVIADAVRAGITSCEADGTRARIYDVLNAREADTLAFFARGGKPLRTGPPSELATYLAALAPLIPHRDLAIDVGTGDGALLEVLAPIFRRVIALDRSEAQLKLTAERVARREFGNVRLCQGDANGAEVRAAIQPAPGADAVFAARVLHHAPLPAKAMRDLVEMARPAQGGDSRGGAVFVLDYEAHDDQALREQEADLWLGFEPAELRRAAEEAGLEGVTVTRLPSAWRGEGPDRHLIWQLCAGWRGSSPGAARAERPIETKRRSRPASENQQEKKKRKQ
jgi:ArsR family transcriptional regulator